MCWIFAMRDNRHPRHSTKTREVTAEERELFRQALAGVRALSNDTIVLRPLPPPMRRPTVTASDDGTLTKLRDPSENELSDADQLCFRRVGLRPADLRKLKNGQIRREGALDLHGLTTDEAKTRLLGFLRRCRERGIRCVHIVHGKGFRSPNQRAVLKPKIAYWLAQHEAVVAYVSARPADGGTGALYVLLKRAS
jgi:DNA-nicking Smr family endonuclease